MAFARHHFDWDWAGAELEYERALELSPGYPMAHLRYAEFLSNSGRPEEALREIARAQQLDPLSLTIANNVGRILYHARRYDDAIAKLHELVALNPNRIYAHIYLAMAYEEKQMYPEAVAECKKAIELTGGHPGVGLAYAYARAGNFAAARHILVDLERPDPSGTQDWVFIAGVYSALGDKNRAFDWLERAYDNRDFFLTYLNVLPWMDPLRSDPRFANLVQRIGIPR